MVCRDIVAHSVESPTKHRNTHYAQNAHFFLPNLQMTWGGTDLILA